MAPAITKIESAEFIKGVIGTDVVFTDGVPEVAFVGRSNVGKSSLINSLTGRKSLVKVGNKPGKTTELNFFSINNKKCYFVDLPGYGYAKATPKQRGKIEKLILWYLMYSEARPRRVVIILDVKAGLTDFDAEMIRVLEEQGHPYLIVANKVDKLNQKELAAAMKSIKEAALGAPVVPYSTMTERGKAELLAAVLADDHVSDE